LLIAAPFVAIKVVDYRLQRALDEQLELARKTGLPTNIEEMRASIEPAAPDENAALVYRSTTRARRHLLGAEEALRQLQMNCSAQNVQMARTELTYRRPQAEIAERAASLPRCWFDRE